FHVTGVQTCALPIYPFARLARLDGRHGDAEALRPPAQQPAAAAGADEMAAQPTGRMTKTRLPALVKHRIPAGHSCRSSPRFGVRSEERRVGEEERTG